MKHCRTWEVYIFSPFLRIWHWTMVAALLMLFLTGRYIGNPFFLGSVGVEPAFAVGNLMSMETIRFWHFVWAYVLVTSFILRIYGWIRYKGDRLLPKFGKRMFWKGIADDVLHYAFFRLYHPPVLRNSSARIAYLVAYTVIFIMIVTGFAMYGKINPASMTAKLFGPVIPLLGNEYNVHILHNYLAWFFPIFLTIHTYFAYHADMMQGSGEVSSMFSGIKFLHGKPEDIKDLE
jgi:Ni/Fe-hydrogenase 1 B-type cytochrome subunit